MKQKMLTFIIAFFTLFIYSCKKDGIKNNLIQEPTKKFETNPSINNKASARLTNGNYTCGDFLSGNYTGTGYYIYSDFTIDVSSLTSGSPVQVGVDVVEVPNRFSIYDDSGSLIATTGWVGSADYWGPWGGSLNTTQTTYVLDFAKSGTGIYTFRVETSTNPLSDSWNASISCGTYTPCPNCPPTVVCICDYGNFSGTYSGSGFYFYSDIVLDAKCTQVGHNIQISCSYLDVPNRFSVYSTSGNLIATTGWVGNANYYGPWGASLSTSYTPVLSFTRSSTSACYILRVETVRNTSYEERNDAWNVTTSCL